MCIRDRVIADEQNAAAARTQQLAHAQRAPAAEAPGQQLACGLLQMGYYALDVYKRQG